jgi:hypothetical protein
VEGLREVDLIIVNDSRTFNLEKNLTCPVYNFRNSHAKFLIDTDFFRFVNCSCPPGYRWDYSHLVCTDCQNGVYCHGIVNGDSVIYQDFILPGGFPLDLSDSSSTAMAVTTSGAFTSVYVLDCPALDACNPNSEVDFTCKKGMDGFLCAKCEPSFYALGWACVPCQQIPSYQFTIPAANVFGLVALFAYYWVKNPHLPSFSTVSIAAFYLQLLDVLDESPFRVNADGSSGGFFEQISRVSPFAIECLFPEMDYQRKFYMTMLVITCTLVLICILLLIDNFCSCKYKSSSVPELTVRLVTIKNIGSVIEDVTVPSSGAAKENDTHTHSKDDMKGDSSDFCIRQLLFVFFNLLSLGYFPLCQTTLSCFNCVEIEPAKLTYLSAAPWLDCNSADYRQLHAAALFMLIVFVLGLPLFFVFQGWSSRYRKSTGLEEGEPRPDRANTSQAWWFYVTGFMWNSSRPEKWWWQCTVMLRQLLLAIILSLSELRSPVTPVLVLIMMTLNLNMVLYNMPNQDRWDNYLEATLMLLALVGYQGSILLTLAGSDGVMGAQTERILHIVSGARYSAYGLIVVACFRIAFEFVSLRMRRQRNGIIH